jgi:AcrR family transcriptional regulator
MGGALTPVLAGLLASDDGQGQPRVADAIEEKILVASFELVSMHGSRITMDEIAERSGVARATLFRRFGSKDGVLEAMLARELRRTLDSFREVIQAAGDPESSIVMVFAKALGDSRTHPIARRLATVEPKTLIDLVSRGDPVPLDLCRDFIAEQIRPLLAGGKRAAAGRARLIADVLLHTVLGYALISSDEFDRTSPDETRSLAEMVVLPILDAARN